MSTNDQISQGAHDGIRLFKEGRYAEAVPLLRDYVSASPSDMTARAYLAACYSQTGNTISAIAEFQRLIDLEPHNPQHYGNLGVAYETVGDLQKAKESYEAAIRISPGYRNAHQRLARVCERLGIPSAPGPVGSRPVAPPKPRSRVGLAVLLAGIILFCAVYLARFFYAEKLKSEAQNGPGGGLGYAVKMGHAPDPIPHLPLGRGTLSEIPPYPGSRQVGVPGRAHDQDGDSALLQYTTDATSSEVEAFYRKALRGAGPTDFRRVDPAWLEIRVSTRDNVAKIQAHSMPHTGTTLSVFMYGKQDTVPSASLPPEMLREMQQGAQMEVQRGITVQPTGNGDE